MAVLIVDLVIVGARDTERIEVAAARELTPSKTTESVATTNAVEPTSAVPTTVPTTSTTPEPTTVTTTAPSTTAAPTPTTSASPTPTHSVAPAAVRAAGPWTLGPYQGLGAWVDVYDWTREFTNSNPSVGPETVDAMAAAGVRTIFIQTAHRRSPVDVIEPERLSVIIDRAHARGLSVVAWYLPTLEDLDADLRKLMAGAAMGVDGLGVDIEARNVTDHKERNRRLIELSTRLRDLVGDRAISAITPSAVHLQVVNPSFWPEFPWAEVAGIYDVIQPMAYFSVRRGDYRNGERYIGENIDRIRQSTGDPATIVHPIGGIADGTTVEDLAGMVRASVQRGAIGGSLYDWATSNPAQWQALAGFNDRG